MGFERLAEQRIRRAEARGALSGLAGEGKPLGPDALEGLSGDALQEALILRGAGGVPPEVDALRRVADLRARLAAAETEPERRAIAAALAGAELEAALLFERTGRMTLAGTLGRPCRGSLCVASTSVSAAAMSAVLPQFAGDVGAGPKKRVVVVLDVAGWHTAKDLAVPDGVHLVLLPPCSPVLQPAEPRWPLRDEVGANRAFTTLGELIETKARRCVFREKNPDLVRSLTRYHGWPHDLRGNGRAS